MKKSLLTLLTFVGLTLNSLAQPNISGRTPTRHAINVATNANVNILFNTTMDESSVNSNTVIISGSQHGIYAGSYSFSGNTAIFDPTANFFPGELITVTVTTGVENSSNVPKAEPDIYTFTVAATSDGSFQNFGNYTAVSGNDTEDVVTADIDEDGDIDIITLTPIQDKLSVFKNNGDGTYSGPTNYTTLNAQDLEAVDIDNDGDIDIVTSNNNAKMMSVFMNNGSGAGTFAASVDYDNGSSHNGLNMTVADMNGDGFTDVIISNIAGSPTTVKVAVFMNSGTGTFGTPTEYAVTTSGFTLGAVDYNNDGAMDIVLADAANDEIRLWENDGTGALLSGGTLPVGDSPYNIAFAKLDSDSYIDVITPNINSDNISVRLASGGFAFFNSVSNTSVGDQPFAVVTGDMDADGDMDIITTNSADNSFSILANNGLGNGFSSSTFTLPDYTFDLKLADVDNDGDLDIVVVNSDGFSVIKNSDGPTVSSITPSNGDFNISASSNIEVVFDQNMDSATLTSSNLKFKSSTRGLIAGSYSYNSGTKTLTFDPTTGLNPGETITVSTTSAIKNSIGGSFGAGFSSSFVVATTDGGALSAKTDFSVGTNPKDAILADLDADGDLDLITVQTSVDSISVMINNGSSFNTPVFYYTGDAPVSVAAGDVDNDGDLDLLVSVSGENVLAKFINNGSGVFGAKTTYATTGVPGAVILQDINYDGDLDAVFANGVQLAYLSNNGSGTFSDQWGITGFSDRNLIAVDLNNDGDEDYVMVRNNSANQLIVVTRNALNNFSQNTYTTDTNPRGVAVGDFDNDGDIDAVTVNYGFSASNISFFANNGSGAFAARVDYSLGSLSTPEDIIATDIDGDGDLDIVVAKTGSDQVVVFTNNGSAIFTLSGSFATGDAPSALVATDLNADGSMDIITTNGNATSVSVLYNFKPLQITAISPTRNDIDIATNSNIDITFNQDIDEATAISANIKISGSVSGAIEGAFNFNSSTDVLTFNPTSNFISGENVSVLVSTNVESNNGAAMSSVTQWSFNVGSSGGEVLLSPVNSENIQQASAVKFIDIDNDGDADMVASIYNYSSEFSRSENGIVVLLNNGSGVYSNSDTTAGIYGSPKQLVVADFNQDGYLDVAGTTKGTGSNSYVEVFINNQSGSFNAPVTYLFTSNFPIGISSGDINSDGYPDILTTRYDNDVIHVLLNDGDGTFTAQSTVGVGDGPYLGLALYDVDSDGDLDLISTNWDGANISVAKNNGNGTFASSTQFSIKSNYAGNLTGGDIDGDGDIDLIVTSTDADEDATESVTVFFNNGSGDYSTSTEIVDFADVVTLADLEGDGDLDLFMVYETKVKIHKNNGSGTFSAFSYKGNMGSKYGNGIDVADNNGDGDIDVAVSTSSGLVFFENGDLVIVSSNSPTNNSINVAASSNITATFNGAMNSSTLDDSSVIVQGSLTGKIAGAISYSGNTVTFNPTNDFKVGETVSLTITSAAENTGGTGLYSPFSSSFIVAASGNGNFVYRDSVSLGLSFQNFVSADMDGDGDVDLVGTNGSNIVVYENNAGSFSQLSTLAVTSSPYDLIVLDLDKDGDLDVIANSGSNSDVFIILNNGSGTLSNSSTFNSTAGSYTNIRMKAGDFNGDGYSDFTYRIGNGLLYVAMNNGDLTFTSKTFNATYYSYLATGDIDNDNDIDIVGIGNDGQIQVMLNSGSGLFSLGASYATSTGAKDIKLADINNDGYLDVLIASYDGYAFDILMNNADGTYAAKTTYSISPYQSGRIDALDYDGDGDLDLAIHAYDENADYGEFLMMAYNLNGTFGNQILFQFPIEDPYYYYGFSTYAYSFLDVDSDGDLDLVAKLSGNNLAIAENASAGSSSAPTTAASSITISSKTYSSVTFSWTNGNGFRRMILVKEGGAVDASPSDNGGYSPNPTFGSGSEIGTGNYVVYGGSGNSATVKGLTGSTTYHIQIFEVNGVPGQEKFYLTGAPVANFTTNPPPVLWDKDDGTVTITKADNADWNLAANQDRITYNIWLTRQNKKGLYNAFSETGYSSYESPIGTEWALGTVEDVASLTFTNLQDALSDEIGENIVNADMVLHLIDADIYVDIKFSSWTDGGNGGGFSYTRGTGTAPAEPTSSPETTAGKAISLNGTDQYLTLNTDQFIPDTFTTEFWVKTTAASTEQTILTYGDNKILIGINSSNQFYVSHDQSGLSGGGGEGGKNGDDDKIKKRNGSKPTIAEVVTITGATTISPNQWYHIVVSAESGGNIVLYVNGTQDASASITTASAIDSSWRLGRKKFTGPYFAGEIDELRIWRTVRTVSEIRSYMFKPYDGISTNLMAYWQFNEGTGSTANDVTNNIEADLSNSPTWVTSTIPVGGGSITSETSITSGSTTVGNATLNMADAFDNPVDVYVSELTASPNQFPSGYNSTFGGKYFVIDVFGTTGTFNASITLNFGPGAFSEVEAETPSNYKLYKRSSTSTGGWTSVGGASSADHTTGKITWNNITSFSQFAAVEGEGYNIIQLADNSDVVAYDDSTFTFASSFFNLNDNYVDTTFTISVSSTPVGSLYLDVNDNSVYDSGTDNLLQNGNSFSYTPSGATKLRFTSTTQGLQSVTVTLAAVEYSDSVPLDFFTVEGKPSLSGTATKNRWITLANPMTTTIGALFNTIWTQGAPNSDAPSGSANLFKFDTNTASWSAITSDLNSTSLSTGQGILAYVFEDDVYGGGVDGGWPKTLSNYGTPIGSEASIAVKNVDVDESVTTNGDEGWNLIGNPFGWPLSIDSVLATLDRADATANANIYLLNSSGNFQAYTFGSISPYQSAFIRVMGASLNTSLTFDSGDMYVDNGEKTAVDKKLELVLTHKESGITSTSEFRYNSNAKTGIDKYDVYYLYSFADKYANLFSKVDDQKLVVNFLPESFEGEFRYPLELATTESGEFTLSWDATLLPEKGELILLDNSTGEEINIRKASSVTFMNEVSKTTAKSENFANKISKTAENETSRFTMIVRGSLTTAVEEIEKPTVVELFQNYPNPFNPETIISFDLTQTARVSIKIYDMLGRLVAEPVSATLTAGKHTKAFNGQSLASGVYLYTMSIDGKPFKTRKLMLLK